MQHARQVPALHCVVCSGHQGAVSTGGVAKTCAEHHAVHLVLGTVVEHYWKVATLGAQYLASTNAAAAAAVATVAAAIVGR